jgi:hypothetical protein
MKKLLMITAMAVAFVAPAKAERDVLTIVAMISPQEAEVLAMLGSYDTVCDALSPKMQRVQRLLEVCVSQNMSMSEVMSEAKKVGKLAGDVGVQKFCDGVRNMIDEFEK